MEQKIGEAMIADFECETCKDSGIQTGVADMDGEMVLVARICDCQTKNDEPQIIEDYKAKSIAKGKLYGHQGVDDEKEED